MADEQSINIIAFAIPIFLAAILLEAALARRRGQRGYYHFGTGLSDVATGTVFQVCEVFLKAIPLFIYAWVFEHWALFNWGEGALVWVVGLLLVDFLYYWWHRESHVINVLWGVHAVHHQSEDFNLAVALRQPLFEPITWFLFYIPMALLGIPVEVFLAAYALDLLYQFFIHTELVDKLPRPIEWLFNTPSHHRVHHGVQAQYLDKNYGGILVIWDRLFGTFEPEGERVVYGTVSPLASYNPVWCNFHYFQHLASLCAQASSWPEKAWVWVAAPGWLPRGVHPDPHHPKRLNSPKYTTAISKGLRYYLGFHYLLIGGLMVPFLLFEAQLSWAQLALGAFAIVLSNLSFLGLIEAKGWAPWLEIGRGPVVALAIVCLTHATLGTLVSLGLGAAMLIVMGVTWNVWRAFARTAD